MMLMASYAMSLNNLPVVYNCLVFLPGSMINFVSFDQDKLQNSGKAPKASLIMENCSAHPDEELLISTDELVMFILPNISIINSAHGATYSGNLKVVIVENTLYRI